MQNSDQAPMNLHSPAELAPFIDHTLLKPTATAADVEKTCAEALRFNFKGVCVNSAFVELVVSNLRGSSILPVSVVGFPFGACLSEIKARETERAIQLGAREVDMVIALGPLKSGDWRRVEEDIRLVVAAAAKVPVKVILETGLLSQSEIVQACKSSESAGAAFVKTATGFLGRGATLDDVQLMRSSVSAKMQIKASGGIKTFQQARELLRAGAQRLGTSSGVALVSGASHDDQNGETEY